MYKTPLYRFKDLGYDVTQLKLIGQGYEGKVYMLPNDKVLKVFYNEQACRNQLQLLLSAKGSRFFPEVYSFDNNSIIMSFIRGKKLSHYLKKNAVNKRLSLELVRLIEEQKRLGFTKLDARLGHIFVQDDQTVKLIDPRKSYEKILPYPRSLLKGLRKHGVLKRFFENIKQEYPEQYEYWIKKFK